MQDRGGAHPRLMIVAVFLVALLGLASVAAARVSKHRHKRAQPVAHLVLDDARIRKGDVIRADPRASRLPRGAVVSLSFGDGRSMRLRRLALVRHRYRRTGKFVITLSVRAGRRSSTVRRRVIVRPRVIRMRPKDRTISVGRGGLKSLQSGSNGEQTAIVSSPRSSHPLGSILSVPGSSRFPDGVLGKVIASAPAASGGTQLTLLPVGLNQAYREVQIATGGSLDDPGVLVENDQGHVIGAASDPRSLRHIGIHFGGTGIRCTGAVTPPLDVNLDLSGLHWDLSFTYPSPSIHFLVTGSPTITIDAGFNVATECHWTLPLHIVVPIPGTPLQVKISPRLEFSTSGSLGFHARWSPRLTYGFDRGNGVSSDAHVFNLGQPVFRWGVVGSADLFFGPDAELSLAGRVGVSVAFGPDITMSRRNDCTDVDAGLKISASAEADVFIARWSFTLFSGYIKGGNLLHACGSSAPPSGGGTPSGGGVGTPSGGGGGTPSGAGGGGTPSGAGGGGASGPLPGGEFAVMNASGGIYWRSAPDWSTPEAVSGNGFYPGTIIAVSCYQAGGATVPGSADGMWEQASWVSGPGSGHGWINEHFIDDGAGINQPSPGVPPCASSSPPPPSGTTLETVGGVTHTWTNYTNAGGTQGPSIQTGQTVGIACKLQGFRVADGDTWWYQIASSPWNGTYYASADAFYNNGQTSGSLTGTPFVDNNVPDCPGSSPPPPPTYAETVGGVTHTWTNYGNAGGTQGPSIATSQTVQVACKVTGFRVADGDTWWYRVASSPWNGTFYASADAFYNNGQTSGSLHGTPFVDNNVPNC
jgi:hypothetical protein